MKWTFWFSGGLSLKKYNDYFTVIPDLSSKEQSLISLLSYNERHIDSLIENSGLSPAEVSATLMQLEFRGLIRQNVGKMFVANCNVDA
jgi:predicted Rossmann fold nucleotide-binding protein DprA/Smf involved in DNA uptake